MRNIIYPLFIITFVMVVPAICLSQASQCEDPEFNDIVIDIPDCSISFDLCLDRYVLEKSDSIVLNIYANDDFGIYDPCASKLLSMPGYPSYGTVGRIGDPDCRVYYKPDALAPSAYRDTFFYALIINDICPSYPDYCDETNGLGKIWTIWAQYTGLKSVASITAVSKNNNVPVTFEGDSLLPGGYFFADGSNLPNNNSDWTYTFNYTDGSSDKVCVHTSCSEEIFGIPQNPVSGNCNVIPDSAPIMTPISGCVTSPGNQFTCVTEPPFLRRENISSREEVTTQWIDTTMVIVEIQNTILPLELGDFEVTNRRSNNHVQWEVLSVENEDYMVLQKSYDGVEFFNVMKYDKINTGYYTYSDNNTHRRLNYYRLAIFDFEDNVTYSHIILSRRTGDSPEVNIYPNPAIDRIIIQLEGFNKTFEEHIRNIKIFDIAGRIVSHMIPSNNELAINLMDKNLHSGIYLIQVELSDGTVSQEKLMIR